jgi:hypothetical protein
MWAGLHPLVGIFIRDETAMAEAAQETNKNFHHPWRRIRLGRRRLVRMDL